MQKRAIELLHLLGLLVARRISKLDNNGRGTSVHSLRVMHGLDGVNGTLALQIGDKRTTATLHVGVAQHRAVLDLAVGREHHADILLLASARYHADEEFALVAVLRVRRLHLYRVVHTWQGH